MVFVTFFETDVTLRRQNDRYDHEKSGPRADPNSTKIIGDLYDSGTKTVHKSCVDNASVASVDKAKSINIYLVFVAFFEIGVILQRLCNDKMIDKIAPNPVLRKSDFPINPWAKRSERRYKSCIDHDAESLPTSTCEIRNCCYSLGGVDIFAFSTGFGNRNC